MGGPLTEHLADRITAFDGRSVSPADVERLGQCFLDWLGAAIAGSSSTPAVVVRGALDRIGGGTGRATILGTRLRASALEAALANGSASHSMELDDVSQGMGGHPSVSVCSAAVALAEALHSSVSELLVALMAGYDVAGRIGIAFGPSHGRGGWHATGTIGTFAATAACSRLLGFSHDEVVAALGVAASQAAGINAGIGTSAKPLHAGKAAAAGVLTASLVAEGATGPADGLERYAALTSTTFDPERVVETLGDTPGVRSIVFKRHACCGILQSEVTALTRLRDQHALRAEDVDAVEVLDSPVALELCSYVEPEDELQAKFSFFHAAAVALGGRGTGPDAFSVASLEDPVLAGLRKRVTVREHADPWTAVSVRVRGGALLTTTQLPERPAADDELPAQRARLEAKVRVLVSPSLGENGADALVQKVLRADSTSKVGEVLAAAVPSERWPMRQRPQALRGGPS
jgi:2-methylcitrate dehydratase PrpD